MIKQALLLAECGNQSNSREASDSLKQTYDNILVSMSDLRSKLTQIKDFNCHILCLKMLEQIYSVRPDAAFECYYQCTLLISHGIASLADQDKEIFFMAVKRITKMVKANISKQDVEMTVDVDSDAEQNYRRTSDNSFKQIKPKEPCHKFSLQQLKHLLRPSVIQHYPKIALLAYEAFSEYMGIFDNEFCSLYSLYVERY